MEKQNRIRAYKGDPVNPGVSRKTAGINFAVEIPVAYPRHWCYIARVLRCRRWKFLLQKNTGQAECAQY